MRLGHLPWMPAKSAGVQGRTQEETALSTTFQLSSVPPSGRQLLWRTRLRRTRLRLHLGQQDRGFLLVEAIVAMGIAAVLFTALAGALVQSTKASLLARQIQQSADVVANQIEAARALSFDGVGMAAADLTTTDPRLCLIAGTWWFSPTANCAAGGLEGVYTVPSSGLPRVAPSVNVNSTTYTIRQYVTSAVGTTAPRVSVAASWTAVGGAVHTKISSTLVAEVTRGTAPPSGSWQKTSTVATVQLADRLDLAAKLTNLGSRDRFTFTSVVKNSLNVTLPWSFVWFVDANNNGVWDPATETTRLDPNNDGVWDSGLLNTNQSVNIVAVSYISPSEPLGAETVTLSVTSNASPTATQPAALPYAITTTAKTCAGCTWRQLFLHNWADDPATFAPTDSTTATGAGCPPLVTSPSPPPNPIRNPMNAVVPTAGYLYDFDTDIDPASSVAGAGCTGGYPGRSLATGGTGSADTNPRRTVSWVRSPATASAVSGTGYLAINGVLQSLDPNAVGELKVYIRTETAAGSNLWVDRGSATYTATPWATSVFTHVVIPIPGLSFAVAVNQRIEVSVQVGSGSSGGMHLSYDSALSTPSQLYLPTTAGML